MLDQFWLHVLLKAEQPDEYIAEFAKNQLESIFVPILEFKFLDLNGTTYRRDNSTKYGLILTSPRAVESIKESSIELPDNLVSEFIFVVGQKTAKACHDKLGLQFNAASCDCGSGQQLAHFIASTLNKERYSDVKLIYPKSSLASNAMEETLGSRVLPVVTYETRPIDDLLSILLSTVNRVQLPQAKRFILNFIFFSPSGVEAFARIDLNSIQSNISKWLGGRVDMTYSSIGKTTQSALSRCGFDVLCVADKPNPRTLVEAIRCKVGE